MRFLRIPLFLLLSAGMALAQSASRDGQKQSGLSFTPDALDPSVDPCTDFYAYACGKWQVQSPIPGDRSSWGRFDELTEQGQYVVRGILEKYSANDAQRSPVEQKIGDYYQSCMDESAIESASTRPLDRELQLIAGLRSKQDLAKQLIHLHREGVGALFSFSSDQDFKDASQVIAEADQGGMALPDRDYYLKDDAKSVEQRKQYVEHVQKMFELLGDSPDKAAAEAKTVMDTETGLAKGALDRVSRRDPEKVYHRMTATELAALSPYFGWNLYLQGIGAPATQTVNVTEPEFFKHMDGLLKTTSLDDWKTYLRWQVVHANVALLPSRFVEENFNFFSKTLRGTKELGPRWKRCVNFAAGDLGEAVGQKYVDATFGAGGKERMLKMVNALEKALGEDINSLPWMGDDTRKQALIKLQAITNRIAYPDKWRDYSGLKIVRGDAMGNSLRANEFEFQRQLDKIGKPVDKNDWPYPPMTVDASYNPLLNNITFPAGILQPPFFDNHADDAMNFGAIGAGIGHELTHGFDDQGSQFDAQGNLRNWWTEQDKKEFEQRTQCIADEYSGFTAVDDLKINGKLTLGENVADNGGLRIAYMALLNTLAGQQPAPIDGFTAQQRFFLGWANVWCQNRTDAFRRMLVTIDPHSPGKWRVNGTVSNMPEFREAYHCKADASMVRENACRVW
ncbi:MAG: M13 family metallopeptidase [Acidobacteriia bacterium]|nr:M13 family metallopeptidase [Terriglobia bacterium]